MLYRQKAELTPIAEQRPDHDPGFIFVYQTVAPQHVASLFPPAPGGAIFFSPRYPQTEPRKNTLSTLLSTLSTGDES
jgi:hypothetical protein